MKDALAGIFASAAELTGTSKIHVLFIAAVIAIILIDENTGTDEKRRRINPTVFLLSLWSGISYAAVRLLSGRKRSVFLAGAAFLTAAFVLSGGFVISDKAYDNFAYYYSGNLMSVFSVIAILAYFLLYYLISVQIFDKKSDRALFMFFEIVLHLFDFYSIKASEFSIFISPGSTHSVIIHGVVPLVMWLYLVNEEKIKKALESEEDDDNSDDIPEEWDMKKHKILNMRNMAIAFAVLFVAFMASIFVINRKINSLYDATMLLENAANTKMTVDEIRDEFGMVAITVMISPEGSVTVVGGGPKSVGTECYETVSKYTNKVDKWYLLGESEADRAAYDFCKEQGVFVSETFIVKGVEKVGK